MSKKRKISKSKVKYYKDLINEKNNLNSTTESNNFDEKMEYYKNIMSEIYDYQNRLSEIYKKYQESKRSNNFEL